jgi:hypothetical protein
MLTKFWVEKLKGRDHAEDLGVDGKLVFIKDIRVMGWTCVDWIHLAQDRDR